MSQNDQKTRKLKKYQIPKKKTEISLNKRATPPTRERAKRADQHVYASAQNIKKINILALETPKIKILTVIRTSIKLNFKLNFPLNSINFQKPRKLRFCPWAQFQISLKMFQIFFFCFFFFITFIIFSWISRFFLFFINFSLFSCFSVVSLFPRRSVYVLSLAFARSRLVVSLFNQRKPKNQKKTQKKNQKIPYEWKSFSPPNEQLLKKNFFRPKISA